jgi:hypothetical protein
LGAPRYRRVTWSPCGDAAGWLAGLMLVVRWLHRFGLVPNMEPSDSSNFIVAVDEVGTLVHSASVVANDN